MKCMHVHAAQTTKILHQIINKTCLADEIVEPRPDMNIKVTPFTESRKFYYIMNRPKYNFNENPISTNLELSYSSCQNLDSLAHSMSRNSISLLSLVHILLFEKPK